MQEETTKQMKNQSDSDEDDGRMAEDTEDVNMFNQGEDDEGEAHF